MQPDKLRRRGNKQRRKVKTIVTALFRFLNGPPLPNKRTVKKAWSKKRDTRKT